MYTPGIAERAPAPFIGLNEEDAERLAVREGDLAARSGCRGWTRARPSRWCRRS